MFALSAITLLMTIVMRRSLMEQDLSLERARYEQQFWLADAYAHYAQGYLDLHGLEIIKSDQPIELQLKLPTSSLLFAQYHGVIHLAPDKEKGGITAQVILKNDTLTVQKINFLFTFNKNQKNSSSSSSISQWHIET